MVEITKALVDIICPNHGRTSCDDECLQNRFYEIKYEKIQGVVVSKNWEQFPRCNRCFLLDNIGADTENVDGIKVIPDVSLFLIQPNVKIVVEENK